MSNLAYKVNVTSSLNILETYCLFLVQCYTGFLGFHSKFVTDSHYKMILQALAEFFGTLSQE